MTPQSTTDNPLSLQTSEVRSMDDETELASILLQTTLQRKASEALLIPEIVSNVFRLLTQDQKTLRPVASVNRIWFEEATRILWEVVPSPALVAIEHSRRNIYAPKIRKLAIHRATCHADLRHCNFESLRVLCFSSGAEDVEQGMFSQYLRLTLEEVSFMFLPPGAFLHGLNQYCPQLRVFLSSLHKCTDQHDLVGFLTKNQSLRRVKIDSDSEDNSVRMFRALSKIPYLEDLTVEGKTPENAFRQLLGSSLEKADCPGFKMVGRVKLRVGLPALSMIHPTFSAMRSLSLDIVIDTENHELAALAHLPLESLQLCITTGIRFSSRELLFLHNAKKLQSLSIRPTRRIPTMRIPILEMPNDHFRQIFANLSALKRLIIWFSLDIRDPDDALIDLGQSCPKLEDLRMYCSIDLTAWEPIPAPLFPSLTFVWLASVNDEQLTEIPNESIAQALAALVDQHAPKLDRFVALNSYAFRPAETNELSRLVMRAHGRIKEISQTRHARDNSD